MLRRLNFVSLTLGLTGLVSLGLVAPVQAHHDDHIEGEVLHYDFRGMGHHRVLDRTDNEIDGRVRNGDGKEMRGRSLPGHGRALKLDGSQHQYVDVPLMPELDVDHFTLGSWIRYTGVENDKTGGRWEVLEKADAYWINVRTDGKVRVGGFFGGCTPQNWRFLDSAEPIEPRTWTHVASTYDGSTLSVWVNGELSASMPAEGRTCVSGQPLAIGAKNHVALDLLEAFWDGKIDDVRIFDRAFSAEEMASLAAPY
jgi:hypothetical protein